MSKSKINIEELKLDELIRIRKELEWQRGVKIRDDERAFREEQHRKYQEIYGGFFGQSTGEG